jgi:CheY-like chemotaxis protein
MSGSRARDDEIARRGGVRAYLTKPLDVPALLAAIGETLQDAGCPDPS